MTRSCVNVIDGEFAAALQGVPIADPEMMLHVRLADLDAFRGVVRTARCTLGVRGSSLGTLEPEEVTVGSELTVVVVFGMIRVLMGDELPVSNVFTAP